MTKAFKRLLSVAAFAPVAFTSCKKEDVKPAESKAEQIKAKTEQVNKAAYTSGELRQQATVRNFPTVGKG